MNTSNMNDTEIQKAKQDIQLDPVNIGYGMPAHKSPVNKGKNTNLEALARKRQLIIDLNELDGQSTNSHYFITQKFNIATFYNIYNDLFRSPHFFYPVKQIDVEFDYGEDLKIPVCSGNLVSPSHAGREPSVAFDSEDDCLWTLVMSCPDEHLEDNGKEYVHWMM